MFFCRFFRILFKKVYKKIKNQKTDFWTLKTVSRTHWWKEIYSKFKIIRVIIFQKCQLIPVFFSELENEWEKQKKIKK